MHHSNDPLTILGRSVLAIASAIVTTGCAADVSTDGVELGQTTEAILNGTLLTSDSYGLVRVNAGEAICSGTILSARWVLSARHCFDNVQPADVTLYRGTNTTIPLKLVSRIISHPTLDVALLELQTDITDPVTGATFGNTLYTGTPNTLQGQTVDCRGYGMYSPTVGDDELRRADLPIIRTSLNEYTTGPRNGQLQWFGDSGGPCFYSADGRRNVISVQSNCRTDQSACNLVASSAFVTWANALMGRPSLVVISNTDNRPISDLCIRADFKINGEPHTDYECVGSFDRTIKLEIDGWGGTWNGSAWAGNLLRSKTSYAGSKRLYINHADGGGRAITDLSLRVSFRIGNDWHGDWEDVGTLSGRTSLSLSGQGGVPSGYTEVAYGGVVAGGWQGNFLSH